MSSLENAKPEDASNSVQKSTTTVSSEKVSTPPGLMWTRAGIIALVSVVSWITISYCSNVYFDRDSAFHDALKCTEGVLNEHVDQFWLLNGTLLGSTRIGRLVLWDADLDIGVLVPTPSDFDKASSALDAECFGHKSVIKHGTYNPSLRVWRKCTPRICAEFVETTLVDGTARTGEGESEESFLFPLQSCTVSGVEAHCPKNFSFYLAQAFGQDWLTTPLTKLF
ncbi:hypothetical protein ABB37_03516 [Leptomonas pyrrhocoris]|uniref:Uncharacterized protein n=1 Tax=Leptomonas pyrrhocoris TaxID=157538 RepID=A0A0M9G541_LEPPY|nr:hypothetical protein ABB37_03516 [Leptomonas pyrrhocoris]XP_015660892.1 hypothetical protein ABB37_03516 [Leptomonas pyrrhocoris]KPA82452.1 hypothetical protein ABB37_03516 [Leptomonas pyrrhocoris]KPA82453.1 hypothetical protein ABB37_03516 [Leptomonas pyrrhocoris]|eukprot:XP_015660891.1 hypothetical protein ABB37_03516 [Leptomonas pyrrhocoris]